MNTEYPVTLSGAGAEVLMWAREDEIEHGALEQLRAIRHLPGLHRVSVMPDVHWGNGATVGSVIAMEQALAPAAVGVDIGCGVNAVRTNLYARDLTATDLTKIRTLWQNVVPVGNGPSGSHDSGVNTRKLGLSDDRSFWARYASLNAKVDDLEGRAHQQLGTLGGGNHFIELCTDAEDRVWVTLHSGSRNIGQQLANQHIAIAKSLPANADLPKEVRDLALFYKGTTEMAAYLNDLNWAQEYAMRSRTIMMELVKRALADFFVGNRSISFDDEINAHHNYVNVEEVDGLEMIVTRKGAISARGGELALIPGSMGTGSYIVRGLGNAASMNSASHGAGRRLSRTAAKREFIVVDENGVEDDGRAAIAAQLGNIEARRDRGIVDELPLAYKDIHAVIAAQSELVEVVQHLQTILCVKG